MEFSNLSLFVNAISDDEDPQKMFDVLNPFIESFPPGSIEHTILSYSLMNEYVKTAMLVNCQLSESDYKELLDDLSKASSCSKIQVDSLLNECTYLLRNQTINQLLSQFNPTSKREEGEDHEKALYDRLKNIDCSRTLVAEDWDVIEKWHEIHLKVKRFFNKQIDRNNCYLDDQGYLRWKDNDFYCHRDLAVCFCGPFNGKMDEMVFVHKDGMKLNNAPENLKGILDEQDNFLEIRSLETKSRRHLEMRDRQNDLVKECVQKRDITNAQVRDLLDEAAGHREKRDTLNNTVREAKEKREEIVKSNFV